MSAPVDEKKETFPIRVTCTECGHAGDVFISDATVARELDAALRKKTMSLYTAFVARRFIALCVIVFLFGLVIGWRIG